MSSPINAAPIVLSRNLGGKDASMAAASGALGVVICKAGYTVTEQGWRSLKDERWLSSWKASINSVSALSILVRLPNR